MLFCSGNAFHHFEIVVGSLVHGRQALKGNAASKMKQPKTIRRHDHLVESSVETDNRLYFIQLCAQ